MSLPLDMAIVELIRRGVVDPQVIADRCGVGLFDVAESLSRFMRIHVTEEAKVEGMQFRITGKLNDGMAEAPPLDLGGVADIKQLLRELESVDAFTNDYGIPMPVGATVLIERTL